MTKNFLFGFLFSVLLIGLVACGQPAVGKAVGDSGSSDSGSSEVVNQSSGLEDSEPKTGAAKSSATKSELKTLADVSEQPSGVFNRLWSDPPTLDPHLTSDTTSAGVVVEIFGGLVGFDTNLQLIPDLADSWDVSTDGLTYTFKIRENAAFHDGTKVTAGDFKWSLERAVNPDTASPTAKTYLGDIVGVEDVLEGRGSEIRGVKAVDDVTLQIQIDAPKAYFLAKLTYPTAYVVDKNNVSEGGLNWTDNPNGTGPFRLTDYKIGERIILERNDLYHLEKAKLAKIQMNLAGGSSMAMYENDEIDITGVGLFDLERIKDPGDPLNGDLVVAEPGYSVNYIGFNVEQPPFDDPKFRRALNHAIDKELIAREVYSDLVVPAYGILPPGFPGFNESLEGLRHDPVLAKKLLSESKYADPVGRPRIVIKIPGTGGTPGLDLEVIINM
ncbi:MAG: peptide ABC transporter substrate-binding protein, partial [Chloroflexota bacterium]|nr:peptide ABC transporter substrate-binding protein [Chloroflexota bacterium]